MIIAIWIISVCEVIRIIQNAIQLYTIHGEKDIRKIAYDELIKSIRQADIKGDPEMTRYIIDYDDTENNTSDFIFIQAENTADALNQFKETFPYSGIVISGIFKEIKGGRIQ